MPYVADVHFCTDCRIYCDSEIGEICFQLALFTICTKERARFPKLSSSITAATQLDQVELDGQRDCVQHRIRDRHYLSTDHQCAQRQL